LDLNNFQEFYHKTLATGLGSGYAPIAPGTFGTLVALIALYPLSLLKYSNYVLIGFVIIFYILGVVSTNFLENLWGKDPSKIVIDEIVGYWIAIIWIPINIKTALIGFVLFRFFDILKPLGIRRLERINGAHGVMLDDVLAGIYTNLIIQSLLYLQLV